MVVYDLEERRKWKLNDMKLAGLEQCMKQDVEKEKIEIAKKMKNKGISVTDIVDMTGLESKVIENL